MIIGLVSIYLFSTTELGQLLKIPLLFTHYFEHKASSNLSFPKFLEIHYTKTGLRYADDVKDMKLPFKTHQNYSNYTTIFIPQFLLTIDKPFVISLKKIKFLSLHQMLVCFYQNNIWQPPKFVINYFSLQRFFTKKH